MVIRILFSAGSGIIQISILLITVVSELEEAQASLQPALQSLNVIVINDSNQPITAALNCRPIDLFGSVLDQIVLPIAIARDVQISTSLAAQFSGNFIDLIPPDEFEIIIDCEQRVSSIESALRLRLLKRVFQTN